MDKRNDVTEPDEPTPIKPTRISELELVIAAAKRSPRTPVKDRMIRDLELLLAYRKRKALAETPAKG